jgi:hypothetical protein
MPKKTLPATLALAILAGSLMVPVLATSQASALQADQAAAGRVSGTVTAIAGSVLTVKDDKGTESKFTVADSARVLQLPVGAKSLSAATPIKLQDIAVGDRVLAKTTADATGATASLVVAMKQSDIAQKQQHDRQEWQTHGISGLVKSVDPSAETITVTTGNGPTAKTLVVQASKTTTIRRYASDSTKFDDAKTATLDQILPGDQLRAKGDKNDDGTQLTADAIVAGTFRSIAGTVVSVDPAANTVTVNDLATKKPFVVNVSAESQLHKLSPMMAQGLAMRLKGASGSPATGQPGAQGGKIYGAPPATANNAPQGAPGAGSGSGQSAGGEPGQGTSGGQRGSGDMQQMLNRAPALQLADLKKGDAVMVLTTEGKTPGAATAITLLAGVEPLLQASPSASQSVLSASWNLNGGAAAQDAQ